MTKKLKDETSTMIDKLASIKNRHITGYSLLLGIILVCIIKIGSMQAIQITEHESINQHIWDLKMNGYTEEVYKYFDKKTKNRKVTIALLETALLDRVPVSVFYGMAYVESRYKHNSVGKNKGGTRDYGLVQLNSKSYKKYSKKYLMDIINNVTLSSSHIRRLYRKEKSWMRAVLLYNCGSYGNVSAHSTKHMLKVMDYAKALRGNFRKEFKDLLSEGK